MTDMKDLTEVEKEFLASLKALFIRYGVNVEKTVMGFGEEMEETYLFTDDDGESNSIGLFINEIVEMIGKK